jgi:hypothetical protein
VRRLPEAEGGRGIRSARRWINAPCLRGLAVLPLAISAAAAHAAGLAGACSPVTLPLFPLVRYLCRIPSHRRPQGSLRR